MVVGPMETLQFHQAVLVDDASRAALRDRLFTPGELLRMNQLGPSEESFEVSVRDQPLDVDWVAGEDLVAGVRDQHYQCVDDVGRTRRAPSSSPARWASSCRPLRHRSSGASGRISPAERHFSTPARSRAPRPSSPPARRPSSIKAATLRSPRSITISPPASRMSFTMCATVAGEADMARRLPQPVA